MRHLQPLLAALLLGSVAARGALYQSGTLNTIIPDANPTGVSSTIIVGSILLPAVGDVNVIINVTVGHNGDLYTSLSHNGTLVSLLNRVGTSSTDLYGFSAAGFRNLAFTAVPEPVNVALGVFGGAFLVGFLVRRYRARQRSRSSPCAPSR